MQKEPIIFQSLQDAKNVFLNVLASQAPNKKATYFLNYLWIMTPLGPMVALADDKVLYLLEFMTRKGLERELKRLHQLGFVIQPGENAVLKSIELELDAYFEGRLKKFKTPYQLLGSPFQQQVWEALIQTLQAKEGRRPRPVVPGSLRPDVFPKEKYKAPEKASSHWGA